MLNEVQSCSRNSPTFRQAYRLPGRHETEIPTVSNLDDDQPLTVPHNQIELPVAATIVADEQPQTSFFQEPPR